MRLSDRALAPNKTLPGDVEVPGYDRSTMAPGIVHIGVGNFHRAHQALVVDRLARLGKAHEWGIRGLALLPGDESLARAMQTQDGLYTLIEKHADGTWDYRIIGSLLDVTFAPDSADAAIEVLTDPRIRIVSLTITEGGYNFDRLTGEFMLDAPAVARDLEPNAPPTTVFGLVYAALVERRNEGIEPFTVLSCDNIQHNGDVAKAMFTEFARAKDVQFADWMEAHVSFPN